MMRMKALLLAGVFTGAFCAGAETRICTNLFLKARTDRENPVGYRVGETIAFDFTLEGSDPIDPDEVFTVSVSCMPEGQPTLHDKRTITKRKGFRFETKMERPGFVRIVAAFNDGAGRELRRDPKTPEARKHGSDLAFNGSAAAEPEKLKPFESEPSDFDAFWAAAKRELKELPMNPIVEEVPDVADKTTRCFRVKLDCLGPRPATGFLTVPRRCFDDSSYRVPVRLKFDGAGLRPPQYRECGVGNEIRFHVNAHGFDLGRDQKYYEDFFAENLGYRGKLPAYTAFYVYDEKANAEPRTSYMFGMVMRVLRALEYAKSLNEWNGKDIIVSGGSQGGLQTMWAAGLGDGITHAEPWITWSCDLGGFKDKRWSSSWRIPYSKGIFYYDPVFMARRIPATCSLDITRVGLGDGAAPPTGIFITYNECRAPKRMRLVQGNGHDGCIPPQPNQEYILEEK